MFVRCPLCRRSLPLLPATEGTEASTTNVWLLMGHIQLLHPTSYELVAALQPNDVPATLDALRGAASSAASNSTDSNSGTQSSAPTNSRQHVEQPVAQRSLPGRAAPLSRSPSSADPGSSLPFSLSLPSVVDCRVLSPLSRYRSINEALSQLFDGQHRPPAQWSSSALLAKRRDGSAAEETVEDELALNKRRKLDNAAVEEAINTLFARCDSAMHAIAKVEQLSALHSQQSSAPRPVPRPQHPSPLVHEQQQPQQQQSQQAQQQPPQSHEQSPPQQQPTAATGATTVPSSSTQTAQVDEPAAVVAKVVSAIGSSLDGRGSSTAASAGSARTRAVGGVVLPRVRVVAVLRRPSVFVADPLYYPALLKAGVSGADASQYVAYYQHVMAQDSLDKWRDEHAKHDRERDRASRDEARKHDTANGQASMSHEQLLDRVGGVEAMRALRFTPL